MLTIPVFLYQVFYIMFASVIPVLLIMWLSTQMVKSGKKFGRSFTD